MVDQCVFAYASTPRDSKMSMSRFVGKERRESGDFLGAEYVLEHLKEGPPRRRVGLIVEGAPARRQSF